MLIDFVLIFGMVIYLIAFFLIIKRKDFSKYFLLPFVIFCLFASLYFYGYHHGNEKSFSFTAIFVIGSNFYIAPSIYLYVRSFIVPANKLKRELLLHLIPYSIILLIYIVPYSLSLLLENFSILGRLYDFPIRNVMIFYMYLENIFFLIYLLKSFFLLRKIRKYNLDIYSNSSFDLQWLKVLIVGLTCVNIFLTVSLTYFLFNISIIHHSYYVSVTALAIYTILFCYLTYRGLYQSRILLPEFIVENNIEIYNQNPQSLSKKQSIPESESNYLLDKIDKLMLDRRIYRDSNLNLRDMAIELNVSNQKLTIVINQVIKTNFQRLINSYRIEDFKNRIAKGEHERYTLLSIATDCGFNSKSSFNRVFKQFEGCTPTQYVKKFNR